MSGGAAKAPACEVRPARLHDAPHMARLHNQSFARRWPLSDFDKCLANAACISFIACVPGETGVLGFVTARAAGPEAEIVTLAVAPEARCRGIGRALIETLSDALAQRGVDELFLEVGEDNHAAAALYRRAGFAEAGKRRGYYAQPGKAAAKDALVLRLALSGS